MRKRKRTTWKDFRISFKKRYRVVLKLIKKFSKKIKKSLKKKEKVFLKYKRRIKKKFLKKKELISLLFKNQTSQVKKTLAFVFNKNLERLVHSKNLLSEIINDEREFFEESLDLIGEGLLKLFDVIPWYQKELKKELKASIACGIQEIHQVWRLKKRHIIFIKPAIPLFLIVALILSFMTSFFYLGFNLQEVRAAQTVYSPTDNEVAAGAGFITPADAYSSNDFYASSVLDNDAHDYYNYNISLSGSSIGTVEVGYEACGSEKLGIQVSWDGGNAWSSEQVSSALSGCNGETAVYFDFTEATVWDATKLNNTNFKVRVRHEKQGQEGTNYYDWIPARITYSAPEPDATSFTNNSEGDLTDNGGRIGQSITIIGTNFGNDPGAGNRSTTSDNVKIGTFWIPDADVTSWSSTSIGFTVSTSTDVYGGIDSNGLIVTAGSQSDSSPLTFYVYPKIDSITVPGGFASSTAREFQNGDTDGIITLNGSRFGTDGTVTVLGQNATTTSHTDTAVELQIPPSIADNVYTGDIVITRTNPSDNKTATSTNFRILPRIQNLNPNSGPVSTQVTISGDHFCQTGTCPPSGQRNTATSTVTFNATNVLDDDVTTWTATTVVALVPTGATTGPVIVKSNSYNSNSATFTVAIPPNATSSVNITDGSLTDGGRPTHEISVSGTEFGNGPCATGTTEVKIGTYQISCSNVTDWSSTTIIFSIPSDSGLPNGGSGSSGLIIRRDNIDDNSPLTFFVYPRIISPTPTTGRQGDSITVSGYVFGATQSTSTVAINGTTSTITNFSSTSIDVTIEGGTISGNIVFTRGADSKTSNNYSFTILPRITSPTPTSSSVNDAITISGDHFGTATNTVAVNSTTTTISSWADTTIDITVPDGTASGSIVVTRSDSQVSNNWAFTIKAQITSLSTTSARVTDSITINGNHFGDDPGADNRSTASNHVTINGAQVANADVTSWSDTAITAKVPLGGTISGNVVVTANSADSNGLSFTILPRITSPTPTSGRSNDGVAISGDHFGTATGTVSINGVTSTISSWGDTSITTTVPLAGSISGNIVVSRSDSQISNNWSFTILPKITSLNPDNGVPGDSVTISGNHFDTDPGAENRSTASDNVTFNAVQVPDADVTSWSDTSIEVKVPTGATTGNVVVRRNNNDSNGFSFTVNTANATSFINTTSGLSDGGMIEDSITVSGSNFGSGPCDGTNYIVKIGTFNVPCSDVSWGTSSIIFSVSTSTNVYGGSGSNGLIIRAGGIDDSTPLTFFVYPKIDSITVPGGFASSTAREFQNGDTDGIITLNGSRFGTNGTVTVLGQNATTTSHTDTAVELQIPPSIADNVYTGDIVFTRTNPSDNKTATSTNFRILPRITLLDPNNGFEEAAVTISGNHFCQTGTCPPSGQRNTATSTITFNATNVLDADVSSWSDTSIEVKVPTGATTGLVVVKNNNFTSNGVTFSVGTPIPDASSFTNNTEGSLTNNGGRPGQIITVTGTDFGSACSTSSTEVKIGTYSVACSDVSSWTATSIIFTVPTSTTAYGGTDSDGLIIRANDQDDLTPLLFYVYPKVTNITTPLISDAAREGETITLTGLRFGTVGTVTILGESATISFWQDTTISATVPSSIADDIYTGAVILTRTSPSGNKSHTATSSFRILPHITSLSPSRGEEGTEVVISGDHFCQSGTCPDQGNRATSSDKITFNEILVPDNEVSSWTDTAIGVSAPVGASSGNVVVRSDNFDSNDLNFTIGEEEVEAPPSGGTVLPPTAVKPKKVLPPEKIIKEEITKEIQVITLKLEITKIQIEILQLEEELQEELQKEVPPPTLPPSPLEIEEILPLPPPAPPPAPPRPEIKVPQILVQFSREIIQTTQKIVNQVAKTFQRLTESLSDSFENLVQVAQKEVKKIAKSLFEPKEVVPLPSEPLEPLEPPQIVKTDTLLVRTALGDINLDLTDKEARVIAGKQVVIFIKPSKPALKLEGHFFFEKVSQIKSRRFFLASIIIPEVSAATALAKTYEIQTLVFVGPDTQGFWKATLSVPPIAGKYKLGVNIDFTDGSKKSVEKIILVDPEGYIYEELARGQLRIKGAKVTLWFFDESLDNYILWPANFYDQKNPQITNETGQYSFLVPEGTYYLEVEHSDYKSYQSEAFQVKEGEPVHFNIKMELKNFWQRLKRFPFW